jgi:hypothetical protein
MDPEFVSNLANDTQATTVIILEVVTVINSIFISLFGRLMTKTTPANAGYQAI